MIMIRNCLERLFGLVLTGLLVALPAGCGTGNAQFTPRGDEARVALETALSAWRDGQPCDRVQATPPVRVIDSNWRDGQQIEKYEILREDDGQDGTKLFSVRLSSKKPKGEQEIVYVVHGRDPIWIYSEEDYNRMLQMDDNPAKAKSRPVRRHRGA
jgi:hypothetical protein